MSLKMALAAERRAEKRKQVKEAMGDSSDGADVEVVQPLHKKGLLKYLEGLGGEAQVPTKVLLEPASPAMSAISTTASLCSVASSRSPESMAGLPSLGVVEKPRFLQGQPLAAPALPEATRRLADFEEQGDLMHHHRQPDSSYEVPAAQPDPPMFDEKAQLNQLLQHAQTEG